MFINRDTYEDMRQKIAALVAANNEQVARISAQQATIDWLMVRVTQVEKERAQLFERYTGVRIAVPEIVKTPVEHKLHDRSFDFPVSFEDMGDVAASSAGIGWNDDGTLKA